MPELTEYLKLKKPIKNKEIADIDVINENSDAIDLKFKEQDKNLDGKEPTIAKKKSGFNLDKTDSTENDSNKLFTAKGAYDLEKTINTELEKKEPLIEKKTGFNLDLTTKEEIRTLVNNIRAL